MEREGSAPDRDELVEEEEAAAAAEAARLGGSGGEDDIPPEERPVRAAGGGEAEGFEEAERDLVERAEHAEGGYAGVEAFESEREEERSNAAYGEPDEIDVTEVVRDPDEGPDDPGEGPGIAADR
jgi:hypothetical protein